MQTLVCQLSSNSCSPLSRTRELMKLSCELSLSNSRGPRFKIVRTLRFREYLEVCALRMLVMKPAVTQTTFTNTWSKAGLPRIHYVIDTALRAHVWGLGIIQRMWKVKRKGNQNTNVGLTSISTWLKDGLWIHALMMFFREILSSQNRPRRLKYQRLKVKKMK